MSSISFSEVEILTTAVGIEPLCGRLMNIGINGFVINDPNDFEDLLAHKNGNWDYIDDELMSLRDKTPSVTVYIPDNEQGAEMLMLLRSEIDALKQFAENNSLNFGELSLNIKNIREEDWADNWKQYFKPFKCGEKLLVKPSWEDVTDSGGRTVLEIDPGSSFGTGQHHTTKLCLETLEKYIKPGQAVLDLGCGSGILGIAASLLGASEVCGVDVEENSVKTAGENFAKNKISKFTLHCGNIITDEDFADRLKGDYDIITVNIVADVIIAMSGIFAEFLKKGGVVILSGIIKERADEVYTAMKTAGYKQIEERESGGWVAAVFIEIEEED
ncbi:MAG: 50S ribosomal protein L11 methyltransferase [Ruminococcus sp.]|nr:50S ribosomal protein L11 methyltransferase [Ruminococcus sp.]